MKLAITNECVLQCKYCFVKKKHSYMDFNTAKNAVDLLLTSSGSEKILRIYGGEPLLHFSLIDKIVPYAFKKAQIEQKDLIITPCTNAVLLTKERISFFKDYNLKLAISIDGNKDTHNKFRVYSNNMGSFDKVRENLPAVFKNIARKNIAAALDVTPSTAGKLYENFKYILKLGFDTINIEPIHGFQRWDNKAQKELGDSINKIIRYIFKEIKNNNFIFLTTINREMKNNNLSNFRKGRCLFFQSLEVCPDGEMVFSSFLFNSLDKNRYIMGDVNAGIQKQYKNCSFLQKSAKCRNCVSTYFNQYSDSSRSQLSMKIRDLFSISAAQEFMKLSESSPRFRSYVTEAKEHICF
ncbi:MAG: radical SAM protein [Candidatus Omnitrophota bacterium]